EDDIEIKKGSVSLGSTGHLDFMADRLMWNKAHAEDVNGGFDFVKDMVRYKVNGLICQGEIESSGVISDLGELPVLDAEWKMKGVEIKEVLASFDNFDQTFITSENIKGKTNIWARTVIPYNAAGNIVPDKITASA